MSIQSLFYKARHVLFALILGVLVASPGVGEAQSPFEHGWNLDAAASELRVMSIKRAKVAESSTFATFSGAISETGSAQISILLDSIDTKVDLRNVRMRFLFFETFKFPEATITTELTPDMLGNLAGDRRVAIDLPYRLDLHGIAMDRKDRVYATLMDNDTVSISSANPIPIALEDFNLEGGREKLQEAASVDIVPVGTISFNFLFRRAKPGTPQLASATRVAAAPSQAALETKGNFDAEACIGRFEILSRAGNIYFNSGSARLDPASDALLSNLLDVVQRCPEMKIEVAGHTDTDGSTAANQRLSEARAQAVKAYLTQRGIESTRMRAVGYGEARPVRPNTSAENKRRNRRIEFSVLDG